KIYEKQANCSTINIDGHLSSTDLAKSLTLPGTSGKTFNMLDRKLLGRVVGACEAQFPGLFAQVHAVLFPVTVPLQVLTVRPLGMQLTLHRSTDGLACAKNYPHRHGRFLRIGRTAGQSGASGSPGRGWLCRQAWRCGGSEL